MGNLQNLYSSEISTCTVTHQEVSTLGNAKECKGCYGGCLLFTDDYIWLQVIQ